MRAQECRKRYIVVLQPELRQTFENLAEQAKSSNADVLNAQIMLLADQGPQGLGWTDKRIAAEIHTSRSKVEYARTRFVAPSEIKRRSRNTVERTRTDPRAGLLRIESRRRYDQKPEKKALKRQYANNLPPEVRARKTARSRSYRQTTEGKMARAKERIRQREFYRTPEGKFKLRQYAQRYRPRTRKWYNAKYQSDPHFRISVSLRKRLVLALRARGTRKTSKVAELIGCTIHEVAAHLERQFQPGMTWANYGNWHIDHIRPCASFDLTNEEEQKRCFHFSNLQPLWAGDNLKKSDRFQNGDGLMFKHP